MKLIRVGVDLAKNVFKLHRALLHKSGRAAWNSGHA
jgi:hypothetical protein